MTRDIVNGSQIIGTFIVSGAIDIDKVLVISGSLSTKTLSIDGNVQMFVNQYYEGTYEITPQVDSQVFETRMKTMRENLTVKAIPYYQVSNLYGDTVFIASDLEDGN